MKYYGGWPILEKNWKKPNQSLEEMLGKMHGELNEHFLVSVLVAPDDKNSSVNILVVRCSLANQLGSNLTVSLNFSQVDQLILALPSREYYMKGSSKSDLMAYHSYMTKIAMILGADPATVADDMQEVLDFETQLANVNFRKKSIYLIVKENRKYFQLFSSFRHHYLRLNDMIQALCITN